MSATPESAGLRPAAFITRPPEKVLFVCLHGAAKSLIAARHLERLARERGIGIRAEFAGTEPDPQLTPAAVAGLLRREPRIAV